MPVLMPKKITVGAITFDVKRDKETHHAMERSTGIAVDGASLMSKGRILVNRSLASDYSRVILLHEVLHMVLGAAGADRFEEGVEETFVGGTAAILLKTLRDNPAFVAYLLDGTA